jgi:sigma-E factor negative regulatory protein RseC
MIEEMGQVVTVKGALAEVACDRQSGCGGCAVSGTCGTSLLERYLGRRPLPLHAANTIGARPGDRVVVGIPDATLPQAAFVAYLMPLLVMLLGALGGEWLAGLIRSSWSQGLILLGGIIGLGLGFRWSAVFSHRRAQDPRYQAVILRRAGLVVPAPTLDLSQELRDPQAR